MHVAVVVDIFGADVGVATSPPLLLVLLLLLLLLTWLKGQVDVLPLITRPRAVARVLALVEQDRTEDEKEDEDEEEETTQGPLLHAGGVFVAVESVRVIAMTGPAKQVDCASSRTGTFVGSSVVALDAALDVAPTCAAPNGVGQRRFAADAAQDTALALPPGSAAAGVFNGEPRLSFPSPDAYEACLYPAEVTPRLSFSPNTPAALAPPPLAFALKSVIGDLPSGAVEVCLPSARGDDVCSSRRRENALAEGLVRTWEALLWNVQAGP